MSGMSMSELQTVVTPAQMSQLQAQIQAYKFLVCNQPLPENLRLAISSKGSVSSLEPAALDEQRYLHLSVGPVHVMGSQEQVQATENQRGDCGVHRFRCTVCCTQFSQGRYFRRHLKDVHRIGMCISYF